MAYQNRNVTKEEIGVTRCCFGEFRCGNCNRGWESSKAWKYFGQECEKCYYKVKPHTVHELFYYCCIECVRVWKYKWIEEGSNCSKCKEVKLPRTYEQFSLYWLPLQLSHQGKGVIDPSKGHKMELCEYCCKLGRLCYTANQHNQQSKRSMPVVINGKLANVKRKQFPVPAPALQFIPDKPYSPGKQPISYRDAARTGASTISAKNLNKSNFEIRNRNQPSSTGTNSAPNIRARHVAAAGTQDYFYNNVQPELTSNNGLKKSDFVDSSTKKSYKTNGNEVHECPRPTACDPLLGYPNTHRDLSPIMSVSVLLSVELFLVVLLIIGFLIFIFVLDNK